MTTVRFKAPAIHCDGCAASIKRSLGRMAGIETVVVDVAERTVTVSFDPVATREEAVRERLELAGFPPEQ
jgi:copper chaperone CopZ